MAETKDITMDITGMTCAACSSRVEKVLNRTDGVEANVNLTTEKASIQYDPAIISIDEIEKKIERVGYSVAVERTEFDITGMTCTARSEERRVGKKGRGRC